MSCSSGKPIVLFLSFFILLSSQSSSLARYEDRKKIYEALSSMKDGKFLHALTLLEQDLTANPKAVTVEFGVTTRELSKSASTQKCRQLLSQGYHLLFVYILRAQAYYAMGDGARGLKELDQALRIFPKSSEANLGKAHVLIGLGKKPDALRAAKIAVAVNPNMREAHELLAQIYYHLGRPKEGSAEAEKAKKCAKKKAYNSFLEYIENAIETAIKLNPRSATMILMRAGVNVEKSDDAAAIEDCKKSLFLSPRNPESFYFLSIIYGHRKDMISAEAQINKAISLDSKNGEYWFQKAEIERAQHKTKAALVSANKAVKLNKDLSWAFALRGSLKAELHDDKGAISDFDIELKRDPSSTLILENKAICCMNLHKMHDAIDLLTKAIDVKPTQKCYKLRAQCYDYLKIDNLALADLEKACQLDPEHSGAIHETASRLEARGGDFESAMLAKRASEYYGVTRSRPAEKSILKHEADIYTRVIEKTPNYPAPYYDRGILRAACGDCTNAASDMRQFLQLSKWNGKTAAYAASLLILQLKEMKDTKQADVVAKEALQKIPKENIAPILSYLTKTNSEAELKASVHDLRFETRDRLLYFISLCQNKQIQKAQDELNWIMNQGDKEIDEFVLLPIYSERIKRGF